MAIPLAGPGFALEGVASGLFLVAERIVSEGGVSEGITFHAEFGIRITVQGSVGRAGAALSTRGTVLRLQDWLAAPVLFVS